MRLKWPVWCGLALALAGCGGGSSAPTNTTNTISTPSRAAEQVIVKIETPQTQPSDDMIESVWTVSSGDWRDCVGGPEIRYFMNPIATETVSDGYGTARKPGALFAKEHWRGDKLVGYMWMTKRNPGYDTDHGDWEYYGIDLDTKEEFTGKATACIACHQVANDRDYIYGDKLNRAQIVSEWKPGAEANKPSGKRSTSGSDALLTYN